MSYHSLVDGNGSVYALVIDELPELEMQQDLADITSEMAWVSFE